MQSRSYLRPDSLYWNLGRRYFRLLKWQPCWNSAYQAITREQPASKKLLEVTKWSFLGMYFFLEMFTIVRNHSCGTTWLLLIMLTLYRPMLCESQTIPGVHLCKTKRTNAGSMP